MGNTIDIGPSKFWTEDDIIYCQLSNIDSAYKLDLKEAKRYIVAITKLCEGKPMPFLIDARGSRGTFSSAAANLIAKSPLLIKLRISEAYISNSIGVKLLIASYKRIYEPNTPYAVFKNMDQAKKYCIETKNKFYAKQLTTENPNII